MSLNQHGFVLIKSCVTYLLECHDVLSSLLKDRKTVDVLYTDFVKIFHEVSHKKLITKMYCYGIYWIGLEVIKEILGSEW